MRYIMLILCLSLLLPVYALAWAPGAGSTDLGGGWTVDTSTAGTLSFKLNGTEVSRQTASGLVIPRLALGPVTSALPPYVGCIAQFGAWTAGDVIAIDQSGFSGSQGATDYMLYRGANDYWRSVSFACASIHGGDYQDQAGTGPAKLDKGFWTPAGYGGAIGASSAASVPTTNAVDMVSCIAPNAPSGTTRIYSRAATGGLQLTYNTGSGSISAASMYTSTLRSDAIANNAGTGAPSFTYGASVTAGYGITFVAGAKPTAPSAGSVILHGGLEAGVAVLSVEKAGATTHIVTITP